MKLTAFRDDLDWLVRELSAAGVIEQMGRSTPPDGREWALGTKRVRVDLGEIAAAARERDLRVGVGRAYEGPVELANQLATMYRHLDTMAWVLRSDPNAWLLACNPSTSQTATPGVDKVEVELGNGKKRFRTCSHDLVVVVHTDAGEEATWVFEMSDNISEAGHKIKWRKDRKSLLDCVCSDHKAWRRFSVISIESHQALRLATEPETSGRLTALGISTPERAMPDTSEHHTSEYQTWVVEWPNARVTGHTAVGAALNADLE
jgi:hypothetical protein